MGTRTKVNLTMDETIVAEARAYGLNMSRIADEAIAQALKAERNRLWMIENRSTLDTYAEEIRTHGPALDAHRTF